MKWVFRIFGVLVLLVVVAAAILVFQVNTVVTEAVETLGPEYTQSEVSLGDVDISLLSGNLSLSDLKVGNPVGFTAPDAFTLGKIAVDLDINSVTTDTIVINSIEVAAPQIVFEQAANTSNLQALQRNIEQAVGPASNTESESGAAKKMIIRDFKVTNGGILVSSELLPDKTLDVTLPDIHLTGIGEKPNGATAAEVAELLLGKLTREAKKAVANSGALGELKNQAKERLEEQKQKLDDKKEQLQDKAKDKLKDLF